MPLALAEQNKPSDRQKKLNEAFGGLDGLVTPAVLQAQRSAARNVEFAQASKLDGRNYAARTAGLLIGEALGKLGSGPDSGMDKAQAVRDAINAAQDETGFEVPEEMAVQAQQQVQKEEAQIAGKVAQEKTAKTQTTNVFEQQHSIITNTMRELNKRGLTSEAASLLPNLAAIEQARVDELQQQADLKGKQLSNIDALDGDTKTIIPNALGKPTSAQIFSDGTARYWDEETQQELTIRTGQYFTGAVTGTADDFTNSDVSKIVPVLRGQTQTLGIMTDLRKEITNNPDALTVGGDALSFINKYIPDLRAFQRGRWRTAEELSAVQKQVDKLAEDAGVSNALQKIAVEKLAFALASSRENGKLSVSDIEFAARAFGSDERSVSVRLALLDGVATDLRIDYDSIAVLHQDMGTHPMFQRAGNFHDAYDRVRGQIPVRRLGETPEEAQSQVQPGAQPVGGNLGGQTPEARFTFDDGVVIE